MKHDIITDLSTIKKSTRMITGIVIHHSASGDKTTARTIDRWHNAKRWKGIGYHYVVLSDGRIQEGRDIDLNGAHTKGHNTDTIGICVIGNFSKNDPLDKKYLDRLIAVANLVNRLREIYGDIPVTGHREHLDMVMMLNATECPGSKVDLDQMRKFFDFMRTVG